MSDTDEGAGALDLDDRELCPDGNCTGLIGDDGRCRICGSAGDGATEDTGARARATADRGDGSEVVGSGEEQHADDDEDESAALDADRELCPDGGCVGLIGPGGHCKVCGRPAEP